MIFGQDPAPSQVLNSLDKQINDIVKGKITKMTNETIDELIKVADRLAHIRQVYKPFLIDVPDLDIALKRQIDELNRISNWIKKEVD